MKFWIVTLDGLQFLMTGKTTLVTEGLEKFWDLPEISSRARKAHEARLKAQWATATHGSPAHSVT